MSFPSVVKKIITIVLVFEILFYLCFRYSTISWTQTFFVVNTCIFSCICGWYYTMEVRTILVHHRCNSTLLKITVKRYNTERDILKQLQIGLDDADQGSKILGVCSSVDGVLIPPDLIFKLSFDSFMDVTHKIILDKDILQGSPSNPNPVRFHLNEFTEPASESSRLEAVQKFNQELRTKGFVIVKVPKERSQIATETFDSVEDFFALPFQTKRRTARKYAKGERRGYWRQIGREIFEMRFIGQSQKDIVWPNLRDFQSRIESAHEFYYCLARTFLELVAEGLDLPPSFFDNFVDDPESLSSDSYSSSMLRIHRYSSSLKPLLIGLIEPLIEDEKRPHADIGLISVAPRATVSGLQVRDITRPEAGWITVEDIMESDDVIVFSGQTLARVTNCQYFPVVHKPLEPKVGSRYSAVFFLRARAQQPIEPIVNLNSKIAHSSWKGKIIPGAQLEKQIRASRVICGTNNTLWRYISATFSKQKGR